MRLLIIEDELGISDAICHAMEQEKIVVEARYDGKVDIMRH